MNTTNLLPPRNFNPRSHKGSDNIDTRKLTPSQIFQSTLPQGERRCFGLTGAAETGNFNPRSHKGSDILHWSLQHTSLQFQSTLPQGERRSLNFSIFSNFKYFNPRSHKGSDSNFTQNSISVLFHFYQSFPHIIFPHTARFRLLIIFCTFFLVRIAQRFPVCFHFAPKQYSAFYNVCSTDLL